MPEGIKLPVLKVDPGQWDRVMPTQGGIHVFVKPGPHDVDGGPSPTMTRETVTMETETMETVMMETVTTETMTNGQHSRPLWYQTSGGSPWIGTLPKPMIRSVTSAMARSAACPSDPLATSATPLPLAR
jgi:hypothetical protein